MPIGDVDDRAGALDDVAFLDLGVRAEDHDADIVGLEVERHALNAVGEFDHLAGLDIVQPVDARDAVTDAEHLAGLGDLGVGAETRDLILDDLRDFCGADIHGVSLQPFIACAREFKRVLIDESIIWLPIFTTSPPRSEGSTERSTVTSRPSRVRSCALSASTCSASSGCAEIDFGGRLAAMLRGEGAEGADDRGQLAETAVLREHAEEIGGGRVELEHARGRRDRLGGGAAGDQRAGGQRLEICRFVERLLHRGEAGLDLGQSLRIARKLEQGGCIASA